MITDDDIKKLKTFFASKDDLKKFATKDDLKKFATKEDLSGFATKYDLESLKQELLEHYDAKADRILEVLDSFAGEIKDHRMKEIVHRQEHAETIERLDKIEKVPAIAHSLKS